MLDVKYGELCDVLLDVFDVFSVVEFVVDEMIRLEFNVESVCPSMLALVADMTNFSDVTISSLYTADNLRILLEDCRSLWLSLSWLDYTK